MTAQGIYPPRHAHIAEQQLNHRHGADVLRTNGVLRPAQRGNVVVLSAAQAEAQAPHTLSGSRGFWRTADVFYYVRRSGKRAVSASSTRHVSIAMVVEALSAVRRKRTSLKVCDVLALNQRRGPPIRTFLLCPPIRTHVIGAQNIRTARESSCCRRMGMALTSVRFCSRSNIRG